MAYCRSDCPGLRSGVNLKSKLSFVLGRKVCARQFAQFVGMAIAAESTERSARAQVPSHLEVTDDWSARSRTAFAVDHLRGCKVALKVASDSEEVAALVNEWKLLHRFTADYFTTPIEFRQTSADTAYLTTLWEDAQTFDASPVPADGQRFYVLVQRALEGLAQLHRAGLLHGDIRPFNLLVSEADGEVRAKWTDLEHAAPVDGVAAGQSFVDGYHDPNLEGGHAQTPLSDLYAFGQTLLQRIPNEDEIDSPWLECLLEFAERLCEPSSTDSILDAGEAVYLLDEFALKLGLAAMPPRPCNRPPTLVVNREAELTWQREQDRWLNSGSGSLVVVHGPRRSGKSTFLRQMAAQLTLTGHFVLDLLDEDGISRRAVPGDALEAFLSGAEYRPLILLPAATCPGFLNTHQHILHQYPAAIFVETSDSRPSAHDLSGSKLKGWLYDTWSCPVFSARRWYQWIARSC